MQHIMNTFQILSRLDLARCIFSAFHGDGYEQPFVPLTIQVGGVEVELEIHLDGGDRVNRESSEWFFRGYMRNQPNASEPLIEIFAGRDPVNVYYNFAREAGWMRMGHGSYVAG